jgi:hypothetical protein
MFRHVFWFSSILLSKILIHFVTIPKCASHPMLADEFPLTSVGYGLCICFELSYISGSL